MTPRRTYKSKNVDHWEISDGSHMIRIVHDKEYKRALATAWVNDGETICRSRSFKTIKGACDWGESWLLGMRH